MQPRIVAALLTAVILGGSLGAAAGGAATYDRGTAKACPADVPDGFVDDEASHHEANVNCVAYWDIARGVATDRYAPGAATRRDQMATFVVRLMATAGFDFPASPPDRFVDDEASVHEESVNRLAAAGVVAGTADGGYHPADLVRRDQMASYIAKAIEVTAGTTLLSGEDHFHDDRGNIHEDRIDDLAAVGIVQGRADGAYAPRDRVRRDQMASFVAKAADHLASLGHWPAFGTNQAYRVTPVDEAIEAVGGSRAYVAQVGTASAVDVALVPCEEVLVGPTGFVTFGDDEGVAGQADDLGATAAVIETVNGSGAGGDHVSGVVPANEAVTTTVAGSTLDVCVRPVVFRDANGNDQLDLDGDDRPTESFGVGGAVRWVPAEAASGAFSVTDVASALKSHDLFTGDAGAGPRTFFYDVNDTFRVGGASATMSQFEAALSAFDAVAGTYADDPGGVSAFDLTDTDPTSPGSLTATVEGSSVALGWASPATAGVDSYRVLRASTGSDCGAEGAYAKVAEVAALQRSFTDTALAAGRYCYVVRAVDDGDESPDSAEVLAVVDLSSPVIADFRAQEGAGGTNGVLDAGDWLQVSFAEAMATTVDDAGSALTLDGGTVTCGANASCVLQPGGTVMRIQVTVTPAAGLGYPRTVTAVSTHWRDVSSNPLTLTGSDITADVAPLTPPATSTPPDMMGSSADATADVVTLIYAKAVVCEGSESQFSYQDSNTATVTPTEVRCNGTSTVTLLLPGDAINGAETGSGSVTYADNYAAIDSNDVRDFDGNAALDETQLVSY